MACVSSEGATVNGSAVGERGKQTENPPIWDTGKLRAREEKGVAKVT